MIDHDEIFKELLTVFFMEFVTAFLPGVAAYIDPDSIEFVDKEIFRGVQGRRKRYVDLVVKVRFRGQPTYFLIHVENQSKAEPGFAKRMFRYFARLMEKFDLPVYPVAIFSYDAPRREEPDHYEVVFPDKTVLQFTYTAIQLNRLSWKDFIQTPNPAAAALMTKMNIAPEDRVKVAGEITRMLLTLKLDQGKADLIFSFMENYLELTGEELITFERELEEFPLEEEKKMGGPYSSWGKARYAKMEEAYKQEMMRTGRMEGWQQGKEEGLQAGKEEGLQAGKEEGRQEGKEEGRQEGKEEGRQEGKEEGRQEGKEEGRQEGKEELIVRQVNRRFGSVPPQVTGRLNSLSADQLNELGEALFDLASFADLENWLTERMPQ